MITKSILKKYNFNNNAINQGSYAVDSNTLNNLNNALKDVRARNNPSKRVNLFIPFKNGRITPTKKFFQAVLSGKFVAASTSHGVGMYHKDLLAKIKQSGNMIVKPNNINNVLPDPGNLNNVVNNKFNNNVLPNPGNLNNVVNNNSKNNKFNNNVLPNPGNLNNNNNKPINWSNNGVPFPTNNKTNKNNNVPNNVFPNKLNNNVLPEPNNLNNVNNTVFPNNNTLNQNINMNINNGKGGGNPFYQNGSSRKLYGLLKTVIEDYLKTGENRSNAKLNKNELKQSILLTLQKLLNEYSFLGTKNGASRRS